MSKFIKIGIFVTICALLSGCQPTPEKSAVVQKNNLDEQIMQTAAPSSTDAAQDIWQETLEQDGVKVTIDAAVEIPDVTSWPVIEVTPYGFTEQDARLAVETLMQGKPIYEADTVRSKADIEQDIIWVNQQLEIAKTDDTIDSSFYESELKDYQEAYENAPGEKPNEKGADLKFKTNPDTNAEISQSIYVKADLGDSAPARLSVDVSDDNMFSAISFVRYDNRHTYYHPYFEATDTLTGLNISKQDALKTAVNTLQKLGADDVTLAYAQAGIDVEGLLMSAFPDTVSDPDRKKCYIFYFNRVIQGIPVTYAECTNGISTDDNGAKYDRVWQSEQIEVAVDDKGVLWLRWFRPCTIGETINTNVQLKNFEEIQDIFRKQMFYERIWSVPGIKESKITIKRAVLGLMRVRMEEERYVYLPVWDFIGEWQTDADTVKNLSFLTLNAVDGSVINRELGY